MTGCLPEPSSYISKSLSSHCIFAIYAGEFSRGFDLSSCVVSNFGISGIKAFQFLKKMLLFILSIALRVLGMPLYHKNNDIPPLDPLAYDIYN